MQAASGRAHPRSRGENAKTRASDGTRSGSSPLTRGKRIRPRNRKLRRGLIPAHAGKTRTPFCFHYGEWAHPRSRGENALDARRLTWEAGSSPLTRGKRDARAELLVGGGLIPAHAGKTWSRPGGSNGRRAHPRSRGENIVDKPNVLAGLGSSPLTRGKHAGRVHAGNLRRLIPAHAGKTTGKMAMCPDPTAHPRSRGENAAERPGGDVVGGSSPLTRGKLYPEWVKDLTRRLIPAHAGKTSRWSCRSCWPGAHPRSRGENPDIPNRFLIVEGSSPLTRGKLGDQPQHGRQRGLIPAHAGKTASDAPLVTVTRAHPRSRGENLNHARNTREDGGSSPLTRGKLTSPDEQLIKLGLIPAHAGKTLCSDSYPASKRAHPRSRGENRGATGASWPPAGSSPLTRGKQDTQTNDAAVAGLIPAHAGKTAKHLQGTDECRAHPRSRGENGSVDLHIKEDAGSSPLTRGKRRLRRGRAQRHGLIPAHAGKTRRGLGGRRTSRAHPRSRGENRGPDEPSRPQWGSSPLTRGKRF